MKELWNLDTDEQDINFKPLAPSPYLSHTHTHTGSGVVIKNILIGSTEQLMNTSQLLHDS